jgi:hypothetical protein
VCAQPGARCLFSMPDQMFTSQFPISSNLACWWLPACQLGISLSPQGPPLYKFTQRDGRKGPPAGNKAKCKCTNTPHSRAIISAIICTVTCWCLCIREFARLFLNSSPCILATAGIVQVAAVLATMHQLGLVHLDVKPGNILQSRKHASTFKLGDYGLAARIDGCLPIEEGDRRYLPPELLSGDHSCLSAADIFSLGITLYELASGVELDYDGEQYASLRRGEALQLPACSPVFNSQLQVWLWSIVQTHVPSMK